jgi:hypothetical protein
MKSSVESGLFERKSGANILAGAATRSEQANAYEHTIGCLRQNRESSTVLKISF